MDRRTGLAMHTAFHNIARSHDVSSKSKNGGPETRKLACYASHALNSRGRVHHVDEERDRLRTPELRTPFQRDRDRILHSVAFRKLMHKTQVFVYHEGDHFRTRLTHTIEVAQIGRSIARIMNLNEDLSEAVALGHDLGHPPFGHAGEDALHTAMKSLGGFDHNEQAIRILHTLEERYPEFNGLNLTWETLEGVVKHNGPIKGKPRPEIKLLDDKFDLGLRKQAAAEAQVANLSDEIAYISHDFDDALRAGLFGVDDLGHLPLVGGILAELAEQFGCAKRPRMTYELVRRLISTFVSDILTQSAKNLKELAPNSADDIRNVPEPMIAFSAQMEKDMATLKEFLFNNMWRHYKVNRMTSKARRAIADLFNLFMEEVDTLPAEWQHKENVHLHELDKRARARVVTDYIASMTDRYAMIEHDRLFNPGPILR